MQISRLFIPAAHTLLIFPDPDPIKNGDIPPKFNMWMNAYYDSFCNNHINQDYYARFSAEENVVVDRAKAVLVCWSYEPTFKFHISNFKQFANYRESEQFQELKNMFPGATLRGDCVVFEQVDMVMFRIHFGEML